MTPRFATAATRQLVALSEWWAENRPRARPLFDLVDEASERIARAPTVPAVYVRRGDVDVRRVLVKSTPYHLYYVVDEGEVVVFAVWSGEVDDEPPLDVLG